MTTAPSLLDQLRAQQPAPTNDGVMLSPEQQAQMAALPEEQRAQLESLIANPPPGMDPQKVVEMVLKQAAQNAPAPAAAAPVAATAVAVVPAPPPTLTTKATKADRTKLIVACASGGLPIDVTREYLELLLG